MKNIHVLALGSELLSGFVLESNAHWLQNQLLNRDAKVQRVTILPDDQDSVVTSITQSTDLCDILVVCGGLGPTDDDLTREAVSEAAQKTLVFSNKAWNEIKDYFQQRQRIASPSNRKQAEIPEGFDYISNPCGTAPGIHGELNSCEVFVFPGVPREFKAMCKASLLPQMTSHPRGPIYKLWGIGESNLVDLLREHGVFPEGLEWGTIARTEGITVHFPTEFLQHQQKETILKNFENVLEKNIYAKEDIDPIQLLCQALKTRGETLGTAESCTGGLLSSWITDLSGASDVYEGSIVSYSNDIKHQLLNVSQELLEQHGAVSEPVALAMAEGALKNLNTDLAISITGVAGPSGGNPDKPVGTIHMAATHKSGVSAHRLYHFSGNRQNNRERSAYGAALLGVQLLRGLP
jgi:nicotinamide-nucleotide amidase